MDRESNLSLSLSLSARFLFTKDDTDIDFELIFNEGTIIPMYVICFLVNFLEIYINREIKGEGKGSILLRR